MSSWSNKLVFTSIALLFSALASAQDFFSSDELDTIPKKFYEKNYRATVCYSAGIMDYWYGASMMVHYNHERFSPIFSINVNPNGKGVACAGEITVKKLSDTTSDVSMRLVDTTYTYKSLMFSIGMASALTPNIVLYANVGSRYQYDSFTRHYHNGLNYNQNIDNKFNLIYGAGAFYVFNNGFTGQIGFIMPQTTLVTGLGFTF